jgi:microcystin-dependent protein
LQSRIPIHNGTGTGLSSYVLGEMGGVEEITLTVQQIPNHTHAPLASTSGGSDSPNNTYWGDSALGKPYGAAPPGLLMNPQSITQTGGSQPHENMMPFLCVSYIISLFGLFPSPT